MKVINDWLPELHYTIVCTTELRGDSRTQEREQIESKLVNHFLVRALLILYLIYGYFHLNFYLFNQYWFLISIAFRGIVVSVTATWMSILGQTYFLNVALRSLKIMPRHFIDP